MKKSIKEPKATINDVLYAVNKLSTDMDQRFNGVEQNLKDVKSRLGVVEVDLKDVKNKLGTVEATVNTQMVKKTDLDEAFARFEHKKVNKLTSILQRKKILTSTEAKMVTAI